ncbi:MAG: YggT family protein [Pyrinomonadaceae bacterium]
MFGIIYGYVQLIALIALALLTGVLLLRLIFSYADPNPFGTVGRFAFKIRKSSERIVYPAANLLARFRVDPRFAPLITILVAALFTYFGLEIIGSAFFIIDGLTTGLVTGDIKRIIGFLLYAALSIYILLVFIRFLSSWFVFSRSTFLGFARRVTDPILLPFQRLIPPVGMFDISGMIVLILLSFIRILIVRIFLM